MDISSSSFYLCSQAFSTEDMYLKKVRVYTGQGVSSTSVEAFIDQVKTFLGSGISVATITREELSSNIPWEKETALLVFGGGEPSQWGIDETTKERMVSYVKNGGRFLSTCAGSYFFSETSQFAVSDINGPHVIERQHKNNLFPGKAYGPLYPEITSGNYLTFEGSRAPSIIHFHASRDVSGRLYYLGGCAFDCKDTRSSLVNPIAYYTDVAKSLVPAIISCKVGNGVAVLSGPHIEFEWKEEYSYQGADDFINFAKVLWQNEPFRKHLWEDILAELG